MPLDLCKSLARALLRERRCLICAAVMHPEPGLVALCPDCRGALARPRRGYCPECGETAAWPDLPLAPCGRCLTSPPPWRQFLFQGFYEGLLRSLAIQLKFRERLLLGHALGGLLAEHPDLDLGRYDCIVPVPLHARRLAERGFNQALELARPMARRLGLPLLPGALCRVRHTRPQAGTGRAEREKNLLRAFQGAQEMCGRRVLLVDDVFTTGATVREAAYALLGVGAASVGVAALARTPAHRLRRFNS